MKAHPLNTIYRPLPEWVRPVWSKQHGAYITVITSWLISVLLSRQLSLLHLPILIFLLSGLNAEELISDTLKRKTPQVLRKKVWMSIYSVICIVCGVTLFPLIDSFIVIGPFLLLAAIILTFLTLLKHNKGIWIELLTMGAFSLGGLLAFNPDQPFNFSPSFLLWAVEASFFGLSVILVKIRLKRLEKTTIPVAALLYVLTLLSLTGFNLLFFLLSLLMLVRLVPVYLFAEKYIKLKVKSVGLIETGFQIALIIILLLFFPIS